MVLRSEHPRQHVREACAHPLVRQRGSRDCRVRSNVTDLSQEYEMYETAGVDEVGEGEEDDEEAA